MNREEWLTRAVKRLRPMFREVGAELPDAIQVSVGFPGGGSARKRIGECWKTTSAGGVNQVFINPTLEHPVTVLATLVHELVHVWDDCTNGHKGPFAEKAKALGLEGKMTATVAGDELTEKLREIASKVGEYPHKGITLADRKPQSTRMLKVVCPEDGYTVRTTQKWIDTGLPSCACGLVMELEQKEDGS